MEIAIIVILFLVGTVASAIQALKYVERRRRMQSKEPPHDSPPPDGS